jgi:hypothetical protein
LLQDVRLGFPTTLQRANPRSILTLPSQEVVEGSKVSSESDDYCLLLRLWWFVGWFHTSCVTCLTGNVQESQEASQHTRPGWWPKEICCTTTLDFTVLLQLWISLFPGSGRFFHICQDCLLCWALACKGLLEIQQSYIQQSTILSNRFVQLLYFLIMDN